VGERGELQESRMEDFNPRIDSAEQKKAMARKLNALV